MRTVLTSSRARWTLAGWSALIALALGAVATPGTTSGYIAKITNTTNTAASAQYFTCAGARAADSANAFLQYDLTEPSGSTTAVDSSSGASPGTNPGTYQGTMTSSSTTPKACPRDSGGYYVLDGSTSYISTGPLLTNPTTFSLELWFRTTVPSGKLIGFGRAQTGSSTSFDRHVYLTTAGKLTFGIGSDGTQIITSTNAYTDGAWHHMVATLSPTTGSALWVDGQLAASNAAFTTPQNYPGYWRIGYDNPGGWSGHGTNPYFTGSMRFAAIYDTVLTNQQIVTHYTAGR